MAGVSQSSLTSSLASTARARAFRATKILIIVSQVATNRCNDWQSDILPLNVYHLYVSLEYLSTFHEYFYRPTSVYPGNCLEKLLVRSGVPLAKAITYKGTLASLQFDLPKIKATDEKLLAFILEKNLAHARAVQSCLSK